MCNMKLYIVVTFPEVQELMSKEDFREHSYLINDINGLKKFGLRAYFVERDWYLNNIFNSHGED